MTTVTVHEGRPAVNVKVHDFGGPDLIAAIQDRFGCDLETAEQASEIAWDSAVSNFWLYWQGHVDDHPIDPYFSQDVTTGCAGRSGGWLEVYGLPEPVEDWPPALVAQWASFEADVLADVEHYSATETILGDIEVNRWAEPGAELRNFRDVDGETVCLVDEQRIRAAAPDLLAACELIAALADGQGRANLLEVAAQAREAIAKATGA